MKNPYKRGNYAKLFEFWQSTCKGIATRQQLVAHGIKIGMSETAAAASVTVILSPREADGRGDCRGNYSAQGHVYFAKPCNKVKGEARKFALRWRKVALAKFVRPDAKPSKAKTAKAKTAKAKNTAKAKSTKKPKAVKKPEVIQATTASVASVASVAPETTVPPAAAVETPAIETPAS